MSEQWLTDLLGPRSPEERRKRILDMLTENRQLRLVFEMARRLVGLREGCFYGDVVDGLAQIGTENERLRDLLREAVDDPNSQLAIGWLERARAALAKEQP